MIKKSMEDAMSVGAEDYIDQLLVKKYSKEKVDNHDAIASMVDPEKMMEAMSDYANMSRNMLALNQRLGNVCAKVKAMNTPYRRAAVQQG